MSATRFEIIPEHRLIRLFLHDALTPCELKTMIESIWTDPNYNQHFNGILHITLRDAGAFTAEDLTQLSRWIAADPRSSRGRWAIVTDSPVPTAFAMLFQQHVVKIHPVEIFTTVESAEHYLGLD